VCSVTRIVKAKRRGFRATSPTRRLPAARVHECRADGARALQLSAKSAATQDKIGK